MRAALRSPRLIVGEMLAVAAAGAALTVVPQPDAPRAAVRFATEHPTLAPIARALGIDHVLDGPWLLVPLGLATASLLIVQTDQWRRVVRLWRAPATFRALEAAPYVREFRRAARAAPSRIARGTRLGLLGAPLFHLGLVLVLLGGFLESLFGRRAIADLYEGERVAPSAAAFAVQWGGPLAAPFALRWPLVIEAIEPERHESGELKGLEVKARLLDGGAGRPVRIAVNEPLALGRERVYVTSRHGVALIAYLGAPGGNAGTALFMEEGDDGSQEGREVVGASEVIARAALGPAGSLPGIVELRLVERGALVFHGALAPGQSAPLPDGRILGLAGVRWWATFRGNRDSSAWIAYLGFAFAVLGAAILFGVVPVDVAVLVTATGTGERVVVSMRPHRFVPLFADRFERLVREEGGPET